MNTLKRALLCDQQRLRAKIRTVYSQDIYLVAYQNLDVLLKRKLKKTQNIIDNTEYFFKNSRHERTKTGTTL